MFPDYLSVNFELNSCVLKTNNYIVTMTAVGYFKNWIGLEIYSSAIIFAFNGPTT